MAFLKVNIYPHECEPPIPVKPPKKAARWECETCKMKWILPKDKVRWEPIPRKEADNVNGE